MTDHDTTDNLSDPADYGGIAADRARALAAEGITPDNLHRFREILVDTDNLDWLDKSLPGLSHRPLWRNEETGASISLVRFAKGSGIPSEHSHASNQFMFCLRGRYTYSATGLTLTEGDFYWNPKGCVHGPTLAEEDSVLLEVYDGPHYPRQPSWYSDPDDAR